MNTINARVEKLQAQLAELRTMSADGHTGAAAGIERIITELKTLGVSVETSLADAPLPPPPEHQPEPPPPPREPEFLRAQLAELKAMHADGHTGAAAGIARVEAELARALAPEPSTLNAPPAAPASAPAAETPAPAPAVAKKKKKRKK